MSAVHHLVAFVRAPRLGRVKTRLAADVGDVAAWTFYRHTLHIVLRRLQRGERWRLWLAVTPDQAVHARGLWPAGWRRIRQGRGDLGERMSRVLRTLPPGPVVIIGTDVPELKPAHIRRAFRALGRSDVVLGPAKDGGYWLVGVRRRLRASTLFDGVRWSTPFALADTLANVGVLRWSLLDVLEDIDDGPAFQRWRRHRRWE